MTNKHHIDTYKMTDKALDIIGYILLALVVTLLGHALYFGITYTGESNVEDSSLYVYTEPCSNLEK